MNVGGTRATWPVITIYGACVNPKVIIGAMGVELITTIASGQSITIDTRPWSPVRPVRAPPGDHVTRFQKLAATTLGTAILLVTIGVIVRATDSGVACPDWPQWRPWLC